jgi:hypothetical protein
VKWLHAGQLYLACSWLHCGLSNSSEVAATYIRWREKLDSPLVQNHTVVILLY